MCFMGLEQRKAKQAGKPECIITVRSYLQFWVGKHVARCETPKFQASDPSNLLFCSIGKNTMCVTSGLYHARGTL